MLTTGSLAIERGLSLWDQIVGWALSFIRKFRSPLVGDCVLVFLGVFGVGVLYRADTICDPPDWFVLARPVAMALVASSAVGIILRLWPRVRALFPSVKLRCMAGDVDELASLLSTDANGPQELEIKIAALKGKLEEIRVRSPRVSDLDGWRRYVLFLRAWVASGNLKQARWFHPGSTAIAEWL